jgi:hypothetical protein
VAAGSPELALAPGFADASVLNKLIGQSPAGASGGSGLPQLGQIRIVFIGLFSSEPFLFTHYLREQGERLHHHLLNPASKYRHSSSVS